jgi:hypothetical protein
MANRIPRISDFGKGILAGIGATVLIASSLGAVADDQRGRGRDKDRDQEVEPEEREEQERGGRPEEGERQGNSGRGGQFFVTASSAGARLWRLNPGNEELTFVGEFGPIRRGGR